MRDLLGADAAAVLPLLDQHDFTFLIEDPGHHLEPRPPALPRNRQALPAPDATHRQARHRYQHRRALPGRLSHQTANRHGTVPTRPPGRQAFPQVALYFENSILPPDLPLLSAAAASVDRSEQNGPKRIIDSRFGVGLPWQGPATVNGKLWPVRDTATLWLPAGPQVVEPAPKDTPVHITDFNGNLKTAGATPSGLEFSYQSSGRAMATLDFQPTRIEIDGAEAHPPVQPAGSGLHPDPSQGPTPDHPHRPTRE